MRSTHSNIQISIKPLRRNDLYMTTNQGVTGSNPVGRARNNPQTIAIAVVWGFFFISTLVCFLSWFLAILSAVIYTVVYKPTHTQTQDNKKRRSETISPRRVLLCYFDFSYSLYIITATSARVIGLSGLNVPSG